MDLDAPRRPEAKHKTFGGNFNDRKARAPPSAPAVLLSLLRTSRCVAER
jgi:hypothetical protein